MNKYIKMYKTAILAESARQLDGKKLRGEDMATEEGEIRSSAPSEVTDAEPELTDSVFFKDLVLKY